MAVIEQIVLRQPSHLMSSSVMSGPGLFFILKMGRLSVGDAMVAILGARARNAPREGASAMLLLLLLAPLLVPARLSALVCARVNMWAAAIGKDVFEA